MPRYSATNEITAEQTKAYLSSNPGPMTELPPVDGDKLARRWKAFLETQNGPDFDDYIMPPGHKLETLLEPRVAPPAKVLFLGTGTGREVAAAQVMGYTAEGVTLGRKNPDFAKKVFGIELMYADHCDIPRPDHSYDVICGFQVFEHCHSPYMFMLECIRLLRPGGELILEWPPVGTFGTDADYLGIDDTNLHHVCCWTLVQAYAIATKSGFVNVECYESSYERPVRKDEDLFFSNKTSGPLIMVAKRPGDGGLPVHTRRALEL